MDVRFSYVKSFVMGNFCFRNLTKMDHCLLKWTSILELPSLLWVSTSTVHYLCSVQLKVLKLFIRIFLFPVDSWMKEHRMKQLGMPCYCGSGSHTYKGEKYRFLVLPRFGNDLHKVFEKHGRRFHPRTALSIAIQIVSIIWRSLNFAFSFKV